MPLVWKARGYFKTQFQTINRNEGMLLTVKKQIEETVELKIPAYYKDIYGHHFINEAGQLITVRSRHITMWEPQQSYYQSSIEQVLAECEPCDKEDFDKAYAESANKMAIAVGAVVINS